MSNFVDFRLVKEHISMEMVLGHYNIQLRRTNKTALRGACPLPTHTSESSKESFSVETGKNIWACQSASCAATRQGKRGGNVLDFVSIMERCSVRDAATQLHALFMTRDVAQTPPTTMEKGSATTGKLVSEMKTETSDVVVNKPLTFTLSGVDATHSYIVHRGIRGDVAEHFGIGFFPGRGSMSGRVVIPIRNENGELVAYAGRSIDGTDPKYKFPTGFQKSAVLFNMHQVVARMRMSEVGSDDAVVVVEGFFDCMNVHQAATPNVVALMGSVMSLAQETLLATFKRVLVLLDGDDAGRAGASDIAQRLVHRTFVKVVTLPPGVQPDQLSAEELTRTLRS